LAAQLFGVRTNIPQALPMPSALPKTAQADITDAATQSFDQTPGSRAKALVRTAIKQIHRFALEPNLATNELIRLAEILTAAGKISDACRYKYLLRYSAGRCGDRHAISGIGQ
jgi:Catechol dioxygenase N terminus